jgi:RHS repeat-associated protein
MATMTTWTNFAARQGAATTTWKYDSRGFMTNKVYADGLGPKYTYTPGGRLKSRLWARGVGTTNLFNNAGELSTTFYTDATAGMTNTHDRLGRVTTVNHGTNTTALVYNDAGHLLSETRDGLMVSNSYDGFLRRAAFRFLIAGTPQFTNTYVYDGASRLTNVGFGSYSASYAYLANSPLISSVTFKDGSNTRLTTTKSYDSLNRLTLISNAPSASGESPISFAYTHNSANQRVGVTNADASRWAYGYDSLGQVTFAKRYWSDGTIVAGQQFEYGYDDIGNRRFAASGGDRWGANLRYENYTANNLNQYTQRTVPNTLDVIGTATNTSTVSVNDVPAYRRSDYFRTQLTNDNSSAALYLSLTNLAILNNGTNADITTNITGNTFVLKTPEVFLHDLDGNLTNDGRWILTWDAENRLTSLSSLANAPVGSTNRLLFSYDWQSRRISKVVSNFTAGSWSNSVTLKFQYDGWNLAAQLSATNAVLQTYSWGADLSGSEQGAGGVGGLLAINDATHGPHFAGYDGNGNVAVLVKASDGTTSANYAYSVFGEGIHISGTMGRKNPMRFSAKFADDESDLLYYGHRYDKPNVGRWPSRDPVSEPAFKTSIGSRKDLNREEEKNLHSFAFNDAVNHVDVLGLACKGKCGPEVAEGVYKTLLAVERSFNMLPGPSKKSVCSYWRIYTVWDIHFLPAPKGCATESCEETYSFMGKCYWKWDINYMLFGKIAQLCEIGQDEMQLLLVGQKAILKPIQKAMLLQNGFGEYTETVFGFAQLGSLVRQGTSELPPYVRLPSGKYSSCQPCDKKSAWNYTDAYQTSWP